MRQGGSARAPRLHRRQQRRQRRQRRQFLRKRRQGRQRRQERVVMIVQSIENSPISQSSTIFRSYPFPLKSRAPSQTGATPAAIASIQRLDIKKTFSNRMKGCGRTWEGMIMAWIWGCWLIKCAEDCCKCSDGVKEYGAPAWWKVDRKKIGTYRWCGKTPRGRRRTGRGV